MAEGRATTAVCEVVDNSVTCSDVRSSSSTTDSPSQAHKAIVSDDPSRQAMLAGCLSDKGWRQR
jgi:hypothetical protein